MPQQPKLIVIAGPNGSGKTSLTNQILRHEWIEGCLYINPDNIAQEKFGNWNDRDSVLKAAQYAAELRDQCLVEKQSLIFETVFSAQDKIDFLFRAAAAGFFIRFFFIGTNSPTINASRVAKRVLEKGHDVPIQKIIDRYFKSIINCTVANNIPDRLYVYDNSVEDAEAKLLFRASNGKVTKKYSEINDWAKPIYESLKF
jgi:predicted ABC-type ATPase